MGERTQTEAPKVVAQVDETESATQQEKEDRDRGRGAPTSEPHCRQVQDRGKGQPKHAARRGQGFGEGKAQGNEVGREKVDHERIAEVMSGVDWKLGRKVVSERKRARVSEVRGPVAPDIAVTGVQTVWRIDIGLVQEMHGPRRANEKHGGARPGMARLKRRGQPPSAQVPPVAAEHGPPAQQPYPARATSGGPPRQ